MGKAIVGGSFGVAIKLENGATAKNCFINGFTNGTTTRAVLPTRVVNACFVVSKIRMFLTGVSIENGDNTLEDTIITRTQGSGILFSKTVALDGCATIEDVQVSQAGLNGLEAPAVRGQDIRIFVKSSRFDSNSENGIHLLGQDNSMTLKTGTACVSLDDIQANNNREQGVLFEGYSGAKLDARNIETLTNGEDGVLIANRLSQTNFPPVEILIENLLAQGNDIHGLDIFTNSVQTQLDIYGDVMLLANQEQFESLVTITAGTSAQALTTSLFGSLLVAGTQAGITVGSIPGATIPAVLKIEDGAQATVCGATTLVQTIDGGMIMVDEGGTLTCSSANGVTCTETCPFPSYCKA